MYAAVLDANVLVPTALCDTLLRLAEDGFYRPLWSERILLEVEHAVMGLYPDIDPARVRRRTHLMSATFEDATVTGWEQVSAGLDLPDENDRHVLAAAIVGGAQAIVTANLKAFRSSNWGRARSRPATPTTSCSTNSTCFPAEFFRSSASKRPTCATRPWTSQACSTAWRGAKCRTSSRPYAGRLPRACNGSLSTSPAVDRQPA